MGRGGMGPGMMGRQREILKEYDKNGDHRLDRAEREAARAGMKNTSGGAGGGPFGPGPGPGRGRGGFPGMRNEPSAPGKKVTPAEVPTYPNAELYDSAVVRTLFLDFEAGDWESELSDFYHTDVDVPAQLTVDGKVYPGVGIGFRGASSYFAVPAGSKRSLNVTIDHTDSKLRLMGYKSLNLLNSHEDSSFLHTVLYLQIARQYTPAPKANFVRLVINGENWGVYTNAQQFDKALLEENYKADKGWRWKVQGSPNGQGGLEYLGEDFARYKQRYSLKSSDAEGEKAWRALVGLCYYLNETEPEHLVAALAPVLDIDSALWFLALEIVLVNNDGYWTRASDYAMFTDAKGKFHILPHDANETFAMNAGGPGGMGGPGGPGGRGMSMGGGRSGIELHPLVGLQERKSVV